MSSASIIITQSGVSGAAGKARRDIVTGSAVTLTNSNNDGVRSWRWRLVEVPRSSAAVLSGTTLATATFTPDVAGTYLVELSVDAGSTGQVDRTIAAVVSDFGGTLATEVRVPSAQETTEANWNYKFGASAEPNDTGWWADLIEWMYELSDAVAAASTPLVDSRGSALTTASAASGGGTVDFTIALGAPGGVLEFLRVVSVAGVTNADIELFRDSSRADVIYQSTGVDPSTEFTERTPATLVGDGGESLESNTIYGRITNNGGSASTFTVEAVVRPL